MVDVSETNLSLDGTCIFVGLYSIFSFYFFCAFLFNGGFLSMVFCGGQWLSHKHYCKLISVANFQMSAAMDNTISNFRRLTSVLKIRPLLRRNLFFCTLILAISLGSSWQPPLSKSNAGGYSLTTENVPLRLYKDTKFQCK